MDGDAFAGYALISLTWSNEAGGISVLLEEAFIAPEYQGQGLGTAFLDFIEREYKDSAKRLRLEVTHSNIRAIRLYEKKGYERFDYLQMVKDI
jgi:ribosomal protein S18 acetylase RimI-like enzyme